MGFFDFFKKKSSLNTQNSKKNVTFRETNLNYSLSQSEADVDPILKTKLETDILPGDILLLSFINGKSEPLYFPKYLKYNYGIDPIKRLNSLFKNEYVGYADPMVSLNSLKVTELKNILAEKDLIKSGRKKELIDSLAPHLSNKEINQLPTAYALTDKGHQVVEKYDYIIFAHKDRYFDVSDAIIYRKSLDCYYSYSDMKWSYLNKKALENRARGDYGAVRFTHFTQFDQLFREKKFSHALMFLFLVFIMDLSGLKDNYYRFNRPFYYETMMTPAPAVAENIKKLKALVSDNDIQTAFKKAAKIFSTYDPGFISKEDLEFLYNELTSSKIDFHKIEKYFEKYSEYTVSNFFNFDKI